jgi:hypothetical protein
MMDAPTPPPWLVSLLAERTAPISMDAELVRQRDAVLGLARDGASPRPAARRKGQRAEVMRAQGEMEAFYARGTAESIETMVGLIDAIPDPQWRLKATTTLRLLIMRARGAAEFGSLSPVAEMLAKVGTASARLGNSKRVEERRERLQPYVLETVTANPFAKPATIATLLRRRKGFAEEFKVPRSTLEGDVAMRDCGG